MPKLDDLPARLAEQRERERSSENSSAVARSSRRGSGHKTGEGDSKLIEPLADHSSPNVEKERRAELRRPQRATRRSAVKPDERQIKQREASARLKELAAEASAISKEDGAAMKPRSSAGPSNRSANRVKEAPVPQSSATSNTKMAGSRDEKAAERARKTSVRRVRQRQAAARSDNKKVNLPSTSAPTRKLAAQESDPRDRQLAERFLFHEGWLVQKDVDRSVRHPVDVSGVRRSPEQIVYYAITGKWSETVERIDPNGNFSYSNLIHSDFELENPDQISEVELESHLGFDSERGEIFWKYAKNRSGLTNRILENQSIVIHYEGTKLVNWFGAIVMYEPLEMRYLTAFRSEEVKGFEPTIDEVDLEYRAEGYGRTKRVPCFYCGDDSSITRDHVIPVSSGAGPRSYNSKDTIPCCSECNSLLGNKSLTTVEERACYLAERIAERYRSTLKAQEFSESELLQLGPRLKSTVQATLNHKKFIAARVSHCHKVAGASYDPAEVSHLRGATTAAKKTALKLIHEYVYGNESLEKFVTIWSEKLDAPKKEIRSILRERLHVDVAIQFKYEQKFDLSATIEQCAALIRS